MAGKYNGMKRAGDWEGKRVRLVRELRNGWVTLPAGYIGTITVQSRGSLSFVGQPCSCCGVKPHMSKIGYFDVELAE